MYNYYYENLFRKKAVAVYRYLIYYLRCQCINTFAMKFEFCVLKI